MLDSIRLDYTRRILTYRQIGPPNRTSHTFLRNSLNSCWVPKFAVCWWRLGIYVGNIYSYIYIKKKKRVWMLGKSQPWLKKTVSANGPPSHNTHWGPMAWTKPSPMALGGWRRPIINGCWQVIPAYHWFIMVYPSFHKTVLKQVVHSISIKLMFLSAILVLQHVMLKEQMAHVQGDVFWEVKAMGTPRIWSQSEHCSCSSTSNAIVETICLYKQKEKSWSA